MKKRYHEKERTMKKKRESRSMKMNHGKRHEAVYFAQNK